jgi:Tol biopolymer transport system component
MITALVALAIDPFASWPTSRPVAAVEGETALSNVRQLTFGGDNAEAYWNVKGNKLTWQSRQPGFADEQIFSMNADGTGKKLMSTGLGRTTCSYFTPNEKWLYYSTTHQVNPGAQKPVDMSKGYVWMVNPDFGLYKVRPNGTGLRPVLIKKGAYVAETTIAPNGKFMVFGSDFEGDLEIYRCDLNGKHIKRLTHEEGYDGGPFISWDSKTIVYRRTKPFKDEAERNEYHDLLKQHLVRPLAMDIWVMDANGNHKRQVTNVPGASFAPFLHPDGVHVLFSSNWEDPQGREFDIYSCKLDGSDMRRLTFTKGFDGFPMVSKDGKKLVFASNRQASKPRETNDFVADLDSSKL